MAGITADVWRESRHRFEAWLRIARVEIPTARRSSWNSRPDGSGRAAGQYPGAGNHRGRPTGLRQDDAAGAVGRTDRVTRGVAVLRRGRQRPRGAAERPCRCAGPDRACRSGDIPGAGLIRRRHHHGPPVRVRRRLGEPPVTVLLDHAEAVTNKQCLNTIAEFALRLPPGWRLALASRTAVPLPTARLRAQGGLLEIT